MRRQTALKATLTAAVAVLLVAASSASAGSSNAIACTLLSSGQLHSTLGLSQSTVLRNSDPTGPGSMAVDTECDWGVWSGAPPTSTAATFALARAGHAAQTGIETWAPHQGHEQDWLDKGYPELIKELANDSYAAPTAFAAHGVPSHTLRVPHLGHSGTGLTMKPLGLAKGLTVSVGCWWEHKTHKAICVFNEEATSKPVTADMLKFAKIAVARFLG